MRGEQDHRAVLAPTIPPQYISKSVRHSGASDHSIVISSDLLWMGTDRAPIADAAVRIVGDRVAAIGSREQIRGISDPETKILDFPKATVLPGLIDGHVHLQWPGDGIPAHEFTASATDARLLLMALRNAQLALRAGVTTVRDVGSRGRVIIELRDAIHEDLVLGPRILASGPPITVRAGHMHYLGGEADTADEVRSLARAHWRMGADFFKLVADGGGTPRTYSWVATYERPQITAAVAEARQHETHMTVHANATEAIRRCVDAGVPCLEHCMFLTGPNIVEYDEALAEEIARRGVYVGHTLQATYRSIERARAMWSSLSDVERAFWDGRRRAWDTWVANAAKLLNQGVRLVASTDAGWSLNPFGEYPLAMELLVQVGASPLQALATGTRIAAEAIGLDGQVGTLEPGKLADLIVVDGNATEDISRLWHVRAVFRGGRMIVRDGELLN